MVLAGDIVTADNMLVTPASESEVHEISANCALLICMFFMCTDHFIRYRFAS